jgi:trans-2,3-dihydro-3-hydroxyanthranilate isomerase
MKHLKFKHVDAFTTTPFTGNPAAVVTDASSLTEQQMLMIARELNLPETAFVLPTAKTDTDLRIRWYTSTNEVPLCGHATIASFHALAEEGKLGMRNDGTFDFRLETASGILPVSVQKEGKSTSVLFGLPMPDFEKAGEYRIDLSRLLNITLKELDPSFPILRDAYLYVPVRRLHSLFTIRPNFALLASFLEMRKFGGICVYTTETIDRDSVVHARFFAPHQGTNEDPVTGSAQGPLMVLLYREGVLKVPEGKAIFQGEQGDAIGRRGRVSVELTVDNGVPSTLAIGGQAVTVIESDLLLND